MELSVHLHVLVTMAAPYRHDRDALESRLTSVEEELVELQRRKMELEAAVAGEEKLEREAEQLRKRLLRDKRTLPLLDQVRVASPCSASWEAMKGDDRKRFCGTCDKNVYDLSAMTRDEATTFVKEHEGAGACIRMHRRADGTLITSDCPVGAKRKRNRRRLAGVFFGAGALAGGAAYMNASARMGDMAMSMGLVALGPETEHAVAGKMEVVTTRMGDMATPPPEAQAHTDEPRAKPLRPEPPHDPPRPGPTQR